MKVLVETKRDPRSGRLKGVTANYIPVIFDGPDALQNTMTAVKIDSLQDTNSVSGSLP